MFNSLFYSSENVALFFNKFQFSLSHYFCGDSTCLFRYLKNETNIEAGTVKARTHKMPP